MSTTPWNNDINVLELPWQQEKLDSVRRRACKSGEANGKLVFGMMESDDVVTPHPAIRRGLSIVKQALESRGYEVRSLTWRYRPVNQIRPINENDRSSSGVRHRMGLRRKIWYVILTIRNPNSPTTAD